MAKPEQIITEKNEFYIQALLVAEVVKRILLEKGDMKLSKKPLIEKKPITEFIKKMRVMGLEKFDEKTYIAAVKFYANEKKEAADKPQGALIIYVPESFSETLIHQLGYPRVEVEQEDLIEDAVGTLLNLIGGSFKSGLTQLDYKELIMSHFSTYQNNILNGLEYDSSQKDLYEITFFIKGKKAVVIDLTMAPVKRYKFNLFNIKSKQK